MTAHGLDDPGRCEAWAQRRDAIATVWLRHFGLVRIPLWASQWLSSSLVAFLVEQDGTSGCLEDLRSFSDMPSLRNSPLTAASMTRMADRPLTGAQEAFATQELQFLSLLYVLPSIADHAVSSVVNRVRALDGTPDDVITVWQEATRLAPRPTDAQWADLQSRMEDIATAAIASGDRALAVRLKDQVTELSGLQSNGDWPGYFSLLVDTLRRVTVRYAGPPLRGWR